MDEITEYESTILINKDEMSRSFCSVDSVSTELTDYRIDSVDNPRPPKKHGLHNARRILQRTYIERMMQGIPIDYFEILKDDIRNIRPLDKNQLDFVKNLNPDQMFEIVEVLNNVTKMLIQLTDLPQDELEN